MRISDWSSDVCSSDLQDLLLDVLRRIGGDDAILHTHRAHHSHGRHVADLRDLLEHDRAIEHRQAEAAVLLGHAHSEHAEIGEVLDVLPREGAILVLHHPWLEPVVRELANGLHHRDRKTTRLNSSHYCASRMPSSA